MLTVQQAASRLMYTERTIRNWLARGDLKGKKIGRHWRIPEQVVIDFEKGHTAEPSQQSSESVTTPRKAPDSRRHANLAFHQDQLLARLRDLEGVAMFPPIGPEIRIWLERATEPRWSISKGFLYQDAQGALSVRLSVEDGVEWDYLRQHLPNDRLWTAVDAWKNGVASDMSARRRLFDSLLLQAQGGTGLPVIAETEIMDRNRRDRALGPYYIHTLYEQIMAQLLGIPLASKRDEEFFVEEGRRLQLGPHTVAILSSARQKPAVVGYLLRAQSDLKALPEAKATADACQHMDKITVNLKREIRRILVAPGLPPDSTCESCRPWCQAATS